MLLVRSQDIVKYIRSARDSGLAHCAQQFHVTFSTCWVSPIDPDHAHGVEFVDHYVSIRLVGQGYIV